MKTSSEIKLAQGNNWFTILEHKTGGKWNTSDGVVKNIVQECTFRVHYEEYKFIIEAYLLDEDNHDTYSIRVYDNTNSEFRDEETQIDHIYLDSTGGGCGGDELRVCPLGLWDMDLEEVDNIIMETLFNNEKGIIKPF